MLREINKRVKENPDYIVPEKYYKVFEKEQIYNYEIPSYFEIPESTKICIELLDTILFGAFDFHILEPLVTYE